jgi:hypothetical protein
MVRAASRGLSKGGHYWEAEDAERGVCGRRRLPERGVCRKAETTGERRVPEGGGDRIAVAAGRRCQLEGAVCLKAMSAERRAALLTRLPPLLCRSAAGGVERQCVAS